jgi:DNA modification methylase
MRNKKILEILKRKHNAQVLEKNKTIHVLINGDALEILAQMQDDSIDLIITDPPYNIGLDYGPFKDKMRKEEYFQWCRKWLMECARILKSTGSMYLISYPEINAYLLPFLIDVLHLNFRRWLTWHYPSNIGHSRRNFTRSQRSILFLTKSHEYVFNKQNIVQHYKNPEVWKIKEQLKKGSKGRGSYDLLRFSDVIELNRGIDSEDILRFVDIAEKSKGLIDTLDFNLLKNVSKNRIKGHPCQLPFGLLRVLMSVSSNKRMWILDPFAGTFTVSAVAAELRRHSIGIELNPEFVKMGLGRLR